MRIPTLSSHQDSRLQTHSHTFEFYTSCIPMSLHLSAHFHGLQRGSDDRRLEDLYVDVSFGVALRNVIDMVGDRSRYVACFI
jgi:hypothetical protein